jgi:hypothetical protein
VGSRIYDLVLAISRRTSGKLRGLAGDSTDAVDGRTSDRFALRDHDVRQASSVSPPMT